MSEPCQNTDRELWRDPDDENGSYYAGSIHVTKDGGIGINCGGLVIVKPLREWHALARCSADSAGDTGTLEKVTSIIERHVPHDEAVHMAGDIIDLISPEIGRLREKLSSALSGGLPHSSDCAVYNAPAYEPGPCDCGMLNEPQTAPDSGVAVALAEARDEFEAIRLLLINDLVEPGRSAFWKAVNTRDKIAAILAAQSQAGIASIPAHLNFLIGRGKSRPDEPLYGVQILDGLKVLAETENDDLDAAIGEAVAALTRPQCGDAE
jgi:hypothetical protein